MAQGIWPEGIWLAGSRITRPDERGPRAADPCSTDGYLVRNADQLEILTPLAPCIGDFSLNAANPVSFGIDVTGGWSGSPPVTTSIFSSCLICRRGSSPRVLR